MAEWIFSASVLILLVLLLRRLLKGRLDPRVRYALWLTVLLRLLCPLPLFESPLSLASLLEGTSIRSAAPAVLPEDEAALPAASVQLPEREVPAAPVQEPDRSAPAAPVQPAEREVPDAPAVDTAPARQPLSVAAVLKILWLAGAALLLLLALLSNLRFALRLRRGSCPLPVALSRPPRRVLVSPAPGTPCLFGLFAPAVYVPESVARDRRALKHVLAHEWAHYRHLDPLWALLRLLALALHWYNPLVWWACALSRQDAELAADAAAVSALKEQERLDYGELLLSLADKRRRAGPLLAGTAMSSSGRSLKERLDFIVRQPRRALLPVLLALVCAAASVAVACTGPVRDSAPPEAPGRPAASEPLPAQETPVAGSVQTNSASGSAGHLDLSGLTRAELAGKAAELSALAGPCTVDLGSEGQGELLWEDAAALMDAAPQLDFLYRFRLYGQELSTQSETVDLRQVPIGDGGAALWERLPYLRRCALLDLDNCGLSTEEIEAIQAAFPEIKVVWRVNFGENYSVRTDVERIVASDPAQGGVLDDEQLRVLSNCTDVKYLDLGHNEGIADLSFLRSMPKLEVLILSYTSASDLSPLAGCKNLEYLELSGTEISDLSPLAGLSSLRHLNIAACPQVTDISPLTGLTGLERLWLGSQDPVPAEQVESFRTAVPDCQVNTRAESPFAGGWRYLNESEDFGPDGVLELDPHPRYALLRQQMGYDEQAYSFSWLDPLTEPRDFSVQKEPGPESSDVVLETVSGENYTGSMLIVPDPSRVVLGLDADSLGAQGRTLKELAELWDAVGGINAGAAGPGDGSLPDSAVICGGQIYAGESGSGSCYAGLDGQNILHVGLDSLEAAQEAGLRYACSCGPVLVADGQSADPASLPGGFNPRSAIGQRADGTILLLTVNGRQAGSLGASLEELADLMLRYGAVNACNMDGGSSARMVFDGAYVNEGTPESVDQQLPTAWLILKEGA